MKTVLALITVMAVSQAILPARALDLRQSIAMDKKTRTYIVHVPRELPESQPVPLVIVLHGGLGNARTAQFDSEMSQKSDKEGFLVAYPNGTGRGSRFFLVWNAGRCCGIAVRRRTDDIAFIKRMIEDLQNEYHIDKSRIFVTGISNGGMMAYRVGAELGDIVAAIAPVAGFNAAPAVDVKSPVSVIAFHGTADRVIPYCGGDGGIFGYKITTPHISQSIQFWVDKDRCSSKPKRTESGSIVKETYQGGLNGTEVCLYTIKGGNHSWPGGKLAWPPWKHPTRELSATDAMWDFFEQHPKLPQTIEGGN
jgi:polyhydroxybutyrate depolymerase